MQNKTLNNIINKLSKSDSSYKRLSDIDYFKDAGSWLPSGSPLLDLRLNTLGFPIGIIEIRGKSQSGKTTMSLHALKNFQRTYPEGIAVILSTERRDNKVYAKCLGVDVDNILVIQCRSIEDVLNKTQNVIDTVCEELKEQGIKSKPKFCFIWDSLGATISNQERKSLEKVIDAGDEDHAGAAMASAARAVKRLFRFLTGEIYDRDIWFFVINHTYDSMKSFGGSKSYGGTAIEFHPTMRLNFSKMEYIKIRDEKVGQISRVTVVKSDFGSYLGDIDLEMYLGKGFILNQQEIDFAVENKILDKNGKKYSFMNGKLEWDSKPTLYDLYSKNNGVLKLLEKKIYTAMHTKVLEERERIANQDNKNDE